MQTNKAIEFEGKTMAERGVEAIAKYLDRRGYEVLESNWKCEAGTADVIARDEDTIVFVDVCVREAADGGMPEEDVSAERRREAELVAGSYLATCEFVDVSVRFDIASLLVVNADRALIRHHINAFG